jgi:hypothetical protein
MASWLLAAAGLGGTWGAWWLFVLKPASRSTSPWGPRWLAVGVSGLLHKFGCWYLNFTHDTEDAKQRGIFCSGRNYLIAWHPHGTFTITALYFLSHFWAKGYPEKGWYVCVASLLLNVPGLAEFLLLCGARSGDSKTFGGLLAKGRTVAIQPGGLIEQVNTNHEKEVLYFPPKLGFIRIAIKQGVPLLPTYAFGENQLFLTSSWTRRLNVWFYKHLHTGSLVVLGLFGIPNSPVLPNPLMLPRYQTGVHVRYGEPVEVGEADPNPSEEKVNEVFDRYKAALQKLFDTHKDKLLPKEVAAQGLTIMKRESPKNADLSGVPERLKGA